MTDNQGASVFDQYVQRQKFIYRLPTLVCVVVFTWGNPVIADDLQEVISKEQNTELKAALQHELPTNDLVRALSFAMAFDKTNAVSIILSFTNHLAALKQSGVPFLQSLVWTPHTPGGGIKKQPRDRVGMMKLLINNGFDPALTNRHGKTAADIAMENTDIDALRVLNTSGKYDAFLRRYVPEPGSPFIGTWSNKKGGFETVGVRFGGDGKGSFGLPIGGVPFFWSQEHAEAVLLIPPSAVDMGPGGTMRVNYIASNDTVSIAPPTPRDQPQILYRDTEAIDQTKDGPNQVPEDTARKLADPQH